MRKNKTAKEIIRGIVGTAVYTVVVLCIFAYPAYFILSLFISDHKMSVAITGIVFLILFVFIVSNHASDTAEIKIQENIKENNRLLELQMKQLNDEHSKKMLELLLEYDAKNEALQERELVISRLLVSKKQDFPWLAGLIADYETQRGRRIAKELETKKHPAQKAADQIKEMSREKRRLKVEVQRYKNQLVFYESLFPWLEDFKELPPEQAAEELHLLGDDEDEYSTVKNYLSPEEYNKLSSAEKWQLALDNYNNRHKTNWHIGIEYERYIGFLCEQRGYKVSYTGATEGLEDRGRDLIVTGNGGTVYVIQCKRWSKSKLIHEKHIMQLFGSVMALELEKNKKVKGVFVTTTTLSDVAMHFAKSLGVTVLENVEYKDYPMIKCHISNGGERIYHLPFDQQYDKINMVNNKDNFYASTTVEAELDGFRHAYRWRGNEH